MSTIGTFEQVRTAGSEERISADFCVIGAGIAGFAAAITLADLGRSVILVDAQPQIGGQCVNSLIGLFCGVFGTAPDYDLLTQTVFEDLFRDLEGTGALSHRYGDTLSVQYDEVTVGRWMEKELGKRPRITVALGAALIATEGSDGEVSRARFASRYGELVVQARGFVDATGDASLSWLAGFECVLPDGPIYGSQQFRLGGISEEHVPTREEAAAELAAFGDQYGVIRREGIPFVFPGTGTAVINMTHVETPLGTLASSEAQAAGRDQADRVARFLAERFPRAFGASRITSYGILGRRQTRWIRGEHTLTDDEVIRGKKFDDSVARTAWPIELHHRADRHRWEVFGDGHLHYVPLRSLVPRGSVNVIAAGRCIDAEPAALSSVRVMGPCAAMGAGAAHALDLMGDGTVGSVNRNDLAERLRRNVG